MRRFMILAVALAGGLVAASTAHADYYGHYYGRPYYGRPYYGWHGNAFLGVPRYYAPPPAYYAPPLPRYYMPPPAYYAYPYGY